MRKIRKHQMWGIGMLIAAIILAISIGSGLAVAAKGGPTAATVAYGSSGTTTTATGGSGISTSGSGSGTSTGGSSTGSCGVVTFTTPTTMTVAPGAKVTISGSYNGNPPLLNMESSNWPPYTSGSSVNPVDPFSVTLTAPTTPGSYEIHFWGGSSYGSTCTHYQVNVTVQNQTPTTLVTNPGNSGNNSGSNQQPAPVTPSSQPVQSAPTAAKMPVTGVDPAIPLAGLGLSGLGMGTFVSRLRKRK